VFGAAPDAVGHAITLNDRPYTVIGVMPASFSYEPAAEVFYPLQLRIDPRDKGLNYAVIARLRAGTTLEQAQAETDGLFRQFRADSLQHLPAGTKTIDLIRFQ